MQSKIKALAASMNVSESDILCLAQSVANGIKRDKADVAFINMDCDLQREMTEAYVVDAVERFERFQMKLMTNKEARDTFALKIFMDLK